MKFYFLLFPICILFSVSSICQTIPYRPLLKTNASWLTKYCYQTGINPSDTSCRFITYRLNYVSTSDKYFLVAYDHSLNSWYQVEPPDIENPNGIYYWEDTINKIVYSNSACYPNGDTIIDYNVINGESTNSSCSNIHNYCTNCFIENIDTIIIQNLPFRKYTFTQGVGVLSGYFIEGIGTSKGLWFDEGDLQWYQELICYNSDTFSYPEGCNLLPVSIPEIFESDYFVYPNPSDDNFWISFPKHKKNVDIILKNINGEIIFTKSEYLSNELKINISTEGLSSGVYYVTMIFEKNDFAIVKFLKK